jgi:hypothetical protein
VRVEGEDVIVSAPVGELKVWKRTPRVGSCSAADTRVFVIIGGGTILLQEPKQYRTRTTARFGLSTD